VLFLLGSGVRAPSGFEQRGAFGAGEFGEDNLVWHSLDLIAAQ
jgi:hypothetical protein